MASGCSVIMKKCVQCRTQIEDIMSRSVCQGGKRECLLVFLFIILFILATKRRSVGSKVGVVSSDTSTSFNQVQQQLQVLKEKVRLQEFVLTSRMNVFFL